MFEKTFHFCPVGLAHVSVDGSFIRVNKRLCDFLGYSDEELTTLTFQELTAPDYLDEDLSYLERLMAGDIDDYAIEKRYVRRDGEQVWAKLTVSLVRDQRGNPDYFISIVEDIDEKKRIQKNIKRAIIANFDESLVRKVTERFMDLVAVKLKNSD